MTTEDIDKAAVDYSRTATPSFVNGEFDRYAIADAFEAGANWRIGSVWHDARTEIPRPYLPVIVMHDDGKYSVNIVPGEINSCPLHWERYAYVDDLISREVGK